MGCVYHESALYAAEHEHWPAEHRAQRRAA